jgi:hypothetical protein
MAANDNRRRKKIEAQRAKRKDKQRAIARVESSSKIARVSQAQRWTLLETRITHGLIEDGITNAYIARRGPHDQVVGVVFLVDTYCLGVKDVCVFYCPETRWNEIIRQQNENRRLDPIAPEALRKLVEGAVAYAKSFGIDPHRDWIKASPIFGDIDASKSRVEFTYGQNGKPSYVSGPYDRPERIKQIMQALTQHAGDGNFHFTVHYSEGDLDPDLLEYETVDDDEIDIESIESRQAG